MAKRALVSRLSDPFVIDEEEIKRKNMKFTRGKSSPAWKESFRELVAKCKAEIKDHHLPSTDYFRIDSANDMSPVTLTRHSRNDVCR